MRKITKSEETKPMSLSLNFKNTKKRKRKRKNKKTHVPFLSSRVNK